MRIKSDKIMRKLLKYSELPAGDHGIKAFKHHANDADVRFTHFDTATWALYPGGGEHIPPDGWTYSFSCRLGERVIFKVEGEMVACGYLYL